MTKESDILLHGEKIDLVFPCEIYRSETKKFSEIVILVPFYGAKKTSLLKHVQMLNGFGYDVVWFQMADEPRSVNGEIFSSHGLFGMKYIWADQIEAVLNQTPGKKIIFGFSNPCASALEAVGRRHAADIQGMVCDGGPSGQLLSSMANYFTTEEPIRFWPLKALAAFAMTLLWSPDFRDAVHKDLQIIPKGFRILSIRGWKDRIISPHQIDLVFEPHTQIEWQKLAIPQGGHCNGLRDFPEDYIEPVRSFLRSLSTEFK